MDHVISFITLLLGVATCALSISIAYIFHSLKLHNAESAVSRLADGIKWQIIGEAVLGAGTLVFTISAYTGHLPDWPIVLQNSIRIIMFFVAAFTTLKLYGVLRFIRNYR